MFFSLKWEYFKNFIYFVVGRFPNVLCVPVGQFPNVICAVVERFPCSLSCSRKISKCSLSCIGKISKCSVCCNEALSKCCRFCYCSYVWRKRHTDIVSCFKVKVVNSTRRQRSWAWLPQRAATSAGARAQRGCINTLQKHQSVRS